MKKKLYIYPYTPYHLSKGSNDYILRLRNEMEISFDISNKLPTNKGIFDLFLKFFKTDIYYFNWIEDITNRRGGKVQSLLFLFFIFQCYLFKKKIVWFIHNKHPHSGDSKMSKRIRNKLIKYSDLILTHSEELAIEMKGKCNLLYHPFQNNSSINKVNITKEQDILIWGTISKYKGILEFIKYAKSTNQFDNKKILIAGKFIDLNYYKLVLENCPKNIIIRNELIPEDELVKLIKSSSFILFTYNSTSIQSSGALNFTLPLNHNIIGPNTGDFRIFNSKGFIKAYSKYEDIIELMRNSDIKNESAIKKFINENQWDLFGNEISKLILAL